MIQYTNRKIYHGGSYDDYLSKDGLSYFYIISNRLNYSEASTVNCKSRFLTIIEAILKNEQNVNKRSKYYDICENISFKLKKSFGAAIDISQIQVICTGDVIFNNTRLKVKGMLDLLIPDIAVIDINIISESNTKSFIAKTGVSDLLWHYSRLAGVSSAYSLIYSLPKWRCEIHKIDLAGDSKFWISKTIELGYEI